MMVVNPELDCKGPEDNLLEPSQISITEKVKVIEKEPKIETSGITSGDIRTELDSELEQEIVETVGHKLSSGLKMLVIQASSDVVQDALKVLRTTKNVKNKAGLLRRAIENQWKPSAAAKTEKKFTLDPDFDEWWGYAKQLGLVLGSELQGDEFLIYSAPSGTPYPYGEIRSMFSMSWLKRKIQAE